MNLNKSISRDFWQIILIGFICLLLLIYIVRINESLNTFEKKLSETKLENLNYKNLITNNFKFDNLIFDTNLIINSTNKRTLSKLIYNKFVLFFGADICGVCNEDLFQQLSVIIKNNPDYKERIIVIVPIANYNNFLIYNENYNLNIQCILRYSGEIIHELNDVRGIFFTINYDLSISKILFSAYASEELLSEYFKLGLNK